jgi:uncharacterized membrane protein
LNYENNRREESNHDLQRIVAITAGCGFILFGFIRAFSHQWVVGAFLAIKLLGLAVCVSLLVEEFGKPIAFVQQLCNLNRRTNCDAVLQSSAAKLFGWLGWSEIGFLYFSGGIVALIASEMPAHATTLLGLLTLAAVPFTFFSLYYQWKIVKKWQDHAR